MKRTKDLYLHCPYQSVAGGIGEGVKLFAGKLNLKNLNYSNDEIYFFQRKKVIRYSVYDDVQFEIIRLSKS